MTWARRSDHRDGVVQESRLSGRYIGKINANGVTRGRAGRGFVRCELQTPTGCMCKCRGTRAGRGASEVLRGAGGAIGVGDGIVR
jgi:hypothetical protein